jgi:hypothetical protein
MNLGWLVVPLAVGYIVVMRKIRDSYQSGFRDGLTYGIRHGSRMSGQTQGE